MTNKFIGLLRMLPALIVLFVILCPAHTLASGPTVYASYTSGDDAEAEIFGTNWYAQTFTPTTACEAQWVRIYASMNGTLGAITVSIREVDETGKPRSYDLVSAAYEGVGTATDWYEIEIPKCPLESKQYALVVRAAAGDSENFLNWRYDSSGTYGGGCYAWSTSSGSTWTLDASKDFLFEIRGSSVLQIYDAKVFSGYLKEGDWLIALRYLNEYPPYYGETVMSDYFAVQLMVGNETVTSTRLRQWGMMPAAIYIGPTLAGTLEWGSAYQIRMIGLFDPYPAASYTLAPEDWKGADLRKLDSWVISTAKVVGNYYEEAFVTVSGKKEVLDEVGGMIFSIGIPMLERVRPELFLLPDSTVPYDEHEWSREYEESLTEPTEAFGPEIVEDATTVGSMFGLDGLDVLRFGFFGSWVIISVGVAAVAGPAAILVSIPYALIGSFTKLIPITPWAVLAAIVVLVLVYVLWLGRA